MDSAKLRELCAALPIFPLPRAVLMPGTSLPLHVFEPRYRALVTYCLEGPRCMGIATLRTGGAATSAVPTIWPEIGIGEIVAHQAFPDGRSNIVLAHVGRGAVTAELDTETPFRLVSVDLGVDDASGSEAAIAALRVLVLQIGSQTVAAARDASQIVRLEGVALVDALAARLFEDDAEQRRYLGTNRIVDRVNLVQDKLAAYFIPNPTLEA